jgi:hypothetical protein
MKTSSIIKSYQYDQQSKELTLELTTGKIYTYVNVDKDTYNEFTRATSLGVYFNKIIKKNFSLKE